MPIVTLTSDFGLNDYYVTLIKGALLCENQNLNIIDITHNINNYDIVQGAFVLRNAYESFPKGTIHILSVNNFYKPKKMAGPLQYLYIEEKTSQHYTRTSITIFCTHFLL